MHNLFMSTHKHALSKHADCVVPFLDRCHLLQPSLIPSLSNPLQSSSALLSPADTLLFVPFLCDRWPRNLRVQQPGSEDAETSSNEEGSGGTASIVSPSSSLGSDWTGSASPIGAAKVTTDSFSSDSSAGSTVPVHSAMWGSFGGSDWASPPRRSGQEHPTRWDSCDSGLGSLLSPVSQVSSGVWHQKKSNGFGEPASTAEWDMWARKSEAERGQIKNRAIF